MACWWCSQVVRQIWIILLSVRVFVTYFRDSLVAIDAEYTVVASFRVFCGRFSDTRP